MASPASGASAAAAGTLTIGGDLTVNRMGFGAMRLTGEGIWGEPKDPAGHICPRSNGHAVARA